MARAPLTVTVIDTAGNVKSGVAVEVRRRSDNALATVYSAETGTGTLSNPVSTDANGRVAGAWLERGAYRLNMSGGSPAIVSYSENFDASPGADGSVDTAWASAGFLPIGSLLAYGGNADPAGGVWLLTNGRALSRSTYAGLFGVIGTTYGAGDGSSTFNIPNTAGRSLVGSGTATGATGATAKSLGAVGGAEAYNLQAAQSGIPGHNHALTDAGHSHDITSLDQGGGLLTEVGGTVGVDTAGGGSNRGIAFNGAGSFRTGIRTKAVTSGVTIAAQAATDAASPHSVMHPFIVTNYLIRAL